MHLSHNTTQSSWYMGSTEHVKHTLQVTQNKVVRFILNKPPRQHIGQHELDMVNLLNTEHRVKQLMMTHMYNITIFIITMPHHTYARDLFVSMINTNTIPDCQNIAL